MTNPKHKGKHNCIKIVEIDVHLCFLSKAEPEQGETSNINSSCKSKP